MWNYVANKQGAVLLVIYGKLKEHLTTALS